MIVVDTNVLGLSVPPTEHTAAAERLLGRELVRTSDRTAYDCAFVALAAGLGTPLVTLDAKVLRAFPAHSTTLCGR